MKKPRKAFKILIEELGARTRCKCSPRYDTNIWEFREMDSKELNQCKTGSFCGLLW
jgi:hypothetical protein